MMRVAVFDTHRYDRRYLAEAAGAHELVFLEARLNTSTAVLARGCLGVCSFVNDRVDAACLQALHEGGTRFVATRSAGFNHIDVAAATQLGIKVARVPEYSPHAVAEHTFALLLALVRRIPRAAARVRDANFMLDGLVGFDLFGKCIGIVGTGRIGQVVAQIAQGFGMRVIAFDPAPSAKLEYVALDELFARADIVTLHCPLTKATRHLIDDNALARMKPGAILLNTGRGALIDTRALIEVLKSGKLHGAALDVYEEEEGVFFEDLSGQVLQDDVLARLLTFPNVIITAHQAFLTEEALRAIATTTMANLTAFERNEPLSPPRLVL